MPQWKSPAVREEKRMRVSRRKQFLADAAHAGLRADVLLGTGDLRPFTADSDFCVAVLGAAGS
jgi:hypothetical protein